MPLKVVLEELSQFMGGLLGLFAGGCLAAMELAVWEPAKESPSCSSTSLTLPLDL